CTDTITTVRLSQAEVEVRAGSIVVEGDRRSVHIAAEKAACTIVIAFKLCPADLELDMVSTTVVVQIELPAASASSKMAASVVVIHIHRARSHRSVDAHVPRL